MNANYAQAPVYRTHKRRSKLPIFVAILGTLCAFAAALTLAGYYFFVPEETTHPVVLIRNPQYGDQLTIGERLTVRALARDASNITRIEFWANGQLLHAETSTIPGGANPMPLLASWQPGTPGTYTLIVRAFNSQHNRAQASIEVQVNEIADRDSDRIADLEDECPDEAGSDTAAGCPDRDLDGLADALDTCPEEAGAPEADGCPAVAEDDRDGDTVTDAEDTCPDEPGSPLNEGCPDRDSDLIPDVSDACPGEAGSGDDGCPAPPAAEPADGGGAPLPDGGVPVPEGGDPGLDIPDSDDDGMSDDADPCPDEAGLPEHGYCPPPDDPAPEGDGGLPGPIPDGGGEETVYPVEFDALSFEVASDEYERVWCYVMADHWGWENYHFEASGTRRWNLEEFVGGENSRTFWMRDDENMQVGLRCWGWTGSPPASYLGMQMAYHPFEEWNGQVITMNSAYGDPGHSFTATYRLCTPSCDESAFPPPRIHTQYYWLGHPRLVWAWDGDPADITGYIVYVDGARTGYTADNHIEIDDYMPACGETHEIQVTAALVSPTEIVESPYSNTWRLEGEACPRIARITFQQIRTYDLPLDTGFEFCEAALGPLAGGLWVTGAESVWLPLNTGYRARWVDYLTGVCLHPNRTRSIAEIITTCNSLPYEDLRASHAEASLIHCPESHIVEVPLGPEDNLSFGGTFSESDRNGSWQWIYNGSITLPPPPEGAVGGTYTISDGIGYMDLIVQVELLPSGP